MKIQENAKYKNQFTDDIVTVIGFYESEDGLNIEYRKQEAVYIEDKYFIEFQKPKYIFEQIFSRYKN